VTLPEIVRSYIAVFVVTITFLFIIVAWAARGVGEAERIATILAGILGLVIGYYFGKEGVDQARAAAEDAGRTAVQAEQLSAVAASVTDQTQEDLRAEVGELSALLGEYKAFLDAAEKNPEQKVKELLETFKSDEGDVE